MAGIDLIIYIGAIATVTVVLLGLYIVVTDRRARTQLVLRDWLDQEAGLSETSSNNSSQEVFMSPEQIRPRVKSAATESVIERVVQVRAI
jgi:hypothetical protein